MNPLRSLYEHPFHKNYTCSQSITYDACPLALGGRRLMSFSYLNFELFLKKWLSQNFMGFIWRKKGMGSGASCPTPHRGKPALPLSPFPQTHPVKLRIELELSISNQMSPLQSLYEHLFHKNYTCPQSIAHNACSQVLGGGGGCIDSGVFLI